MEHKKWDRGYAFVKVNGHNVLMQSLLWKIVEIKK
jgi:hypothetical protein